MGSASGEMVGANAGYVTEVLVDENKNFSWGGWGTANAVGAVNAGTAMTSEIFKAGMLPEDVSLRPFPGLEGKVAENSVKVGAETFKYVNDEIVSYGAQEK
ncbi:hypothetical protein [Gleimia europaea]|uniref:Uncharacterized protein n=1 Tax=Gleimia europaea ACS-120-V-Col10b TaxID=883069 RepID=A0A9W5VVQ4_9ACTO|nr:hypothetical protein [Gleimia europaea]EPD29494.1 hypothetical protein HMPREF9238_01474 [Gleimia europaea ACS-120-V-Col10b]